MRALFLAASAFKASSLVIDMELGDSDVPACNTQTLIRAFSDARLRTGLMDSQLTWRRDIRKRWYKRPKRPEALTDIVSEQWIRPYNRSMSKFVGKTMKWLVGSWTFNYNHDQCA